MTIGTSILLSTIIVSFIVTFLFTRKSWKWSKILKRGFLIFGVAILVSLGGYFTYDYFSNRPKVEVEYWGIKLGDSYRDVLFLNGKPDTVYGPSERYDYDSLLYYGRIQNGSSDERPLIIGLKGNSVVSVICYWTDSSVLSFIQGIGRNSTVEDVKSKFGKPDSIRESENGTQRSWFYGKYKVRFSFEKGLVTSAGIYDPKR